MATWSQLAAQFYQHCATIYTNLHGGTTDASQPTHFPILFSKNKYSKIFLGPFPGHLGLMPTIFEFPYSRYRTSKFSRRLDLNSRFLLRGTSFHLLLGLVNIFFRSKFKTAHTEGITAVVACCGMLWHVVACCGILCLLWHAVEYCDMMWHAVAYCDILGMLWNVVACCGMLWNVVTCCGMQQTVCLTCEHCPQQSVIHFNI